MEGIFKRREGRENVQGEVQARFQKSLCRSTQPLATSRCSPCLTESHPQDVLEPCISYDCVV